MSETYTFVEEWKSAQKSILKTIFPSFSKKEIERFLDSYISKSLINVNATLHNNYAHQSLDTTLLDVIDWIKEKEPICAGFGMFFKNQNLSMNPNAKMIINFLDLRKEFKKLLKDFLETSYEYATADRRQLTEKVNANSFYGCNGAAVSRFFNIFTASSVTLTGQSLISTTAQAFEAFLANNVLFYDLDNCFEFLEKVRGEKYRTVVPNLPNVTLDAVFERLKNTFYNFRPEYELPLFSYLMNISQDDLNRLYFKNNLYEFSQLPYIKNEIIEMMEDVEEFMSPEKVPTNIKDRLDELWTIYRDWVFYNHSPIGRIDRLKTHVRKSVVTVDTDSNMINLDPWVEFTREVIVPESEELSSRSYDNIRFIAINLLCTLLTDMINEVLQKYTKNVNVPKEHRWRINMKNEFLFTKMMTTSSKKRYISSVRLREGKEIFPEKLDIKGLDFMKASTREETMNRFKRIIKKRIIDHETVDLMGTLDDLEQFSQDIRNSLMNGEKTFLNPENAKEPEAYDDPYKQQGFRGVLAWNFAYPDRQIGLPEKVDIIKLSVKSAEDLVDLERVEPEIYESLIENIFESKNEKIRAKGLAVIALPRNEPKIPDWLLPYIDYDLIVNKNISQFRAVLESMGLASIKMDDMSFYTNIKKIG